MWKKHGNTLHLTPGNTDKQGGCRGEEFSAALHPLFT